MKIKWNSLTRIILFATLFTCLLLTVQTRVSLTSQVKTTHAASSQTFINPTGNGGDPYVTYWNGDYYFPYTQTVNNQIQVIVHRSTAIEGVTAGPATVVWTPGSGEANTDIWSTNIHYLGGTWYIYFCADAGNGTDNQRLYVLKGGSNPMDPYSYVGQLDTGNVRTLDPDVIAAPTGSAYPYYITWEQGETSSNPATLRIAGMSDPTTIVTSSNVQIASVTQSWEGATVEGPRFLPHGSSMFIVYSGNDVWTCNYALGLLTNTTNDLTNAANWTKNANNPVFAQNGNVCGPGRATFTTSPDGTQDWMVYHTNGGYYNDASNSVDSREDQAQPFAWNNDGTPNFGTPVQKGTAIPIPSGEVSVANNSFEADNAAVSVPQGWTTWSGTNGTDANASYTETGAYVGSYRLAHWKQSAPYEVGTWQVVSGLTNGASYQFCAWVQGSGNNSNGDVQAIQAKYYDNNGSTQQVPIPGTTTWTNICTPSFSVQNGQAQILVWSKVPADAWVRVDNVTLVKTS